MNRTRKNVLVLIAIIYKYTTTSVTENTFMYHWNIDQKSLKLSAVLIFCITSADLIAIG